MNSSTLRWSQHSAVRHIVKRYITKRKLRERELRKEYVVQYVGENASRADRVYVWGNAVTGALGIQTYLRPKKGLSPVKKRRYPARLKFMDDHHYKVLDAACGYGFTVYVAKSRHDEIKVLGCGINTSSQIGFHEYPRNTGRILDYIIEPAPIVMPLVHPDSTRVQQVSCGRAHTLLLTDNEGVYSLGENSYGQCGRPVVEGEVFHKTSNIYRIEGLPDNIQKVVCGQDHSLFLTNDGAVYSCGLGADGQTGLGHYKIAGRPAKLGGDIENVKIKELASTVDCVLAMSSEGDVFGWGNSEYNQLLGVTDLTQVNTPRRLPVRNCGKIVKVASGGSACAVLNDKGQVFVWGYGLLGKGPNLEYTDYPELIPETLFGCNELQPDVKVIDLKCGLSHFAAINDQHDLYTWGKNKQGCLGLPMNKIQDQSFPLKVAMPAEVERVFCGVDHMVALCRSYS